MTVRITKPKINVREALDNNQVDSDDVLRVLYDAPDSVAIGSNRYNNASGVAKLNVSHSTEHQYNDGNVQIGNCVLGLANFPDSEQDNQHTTLQFNLNAGTYNRVGGISFVAQSENNQLTDLAFWTDGGSSLSRTEKMRITGQGNIGINNRNPQYYFDQTISTGQNNGEKKIHRSLQNEVVTGYDLGTSDGQSSVVTVTVGIGWLRGVTLVSDFTGSRNSSGPDSYMQRFAHALMREGNGLRLSTRLTNLEYAAGSSAPVSVGTGTQAPYVDGETIVITYLIAGGSVGYDSRMLFTGKGPGITDISVSAVST